MATIACLGVIIALMCRPTLSFGINRTSCPDTSQWRMRASSFCNRSEPAYFCLYDANTNVFKEFCRKAPDVQRPGYEFVIRGNLDGRKCRNDRYQPFKLTTDGQSKCMFKKSKCTDEGQIMYNDGTTISDSLCRCDSTQSYGFVKTTGDRCFCDPSIEDCTCYKINCQDGYVLSSDYMCTEWEHFSGTNNCTDIKSSRSEIHRVIPSRDDRHLMTNQESYLSVFKNSKFTGHIILCLMTAAALVCFTVVFIKKDIYSDRIWKTGTMYASKGIAGDSVLGQGEHLLPLRHALNNYEVTLWQLQDYQGELDCVYGDAFFGQGVYLSPVHPALNKYGATFWQQQYNHGEIIFDRTWTAGIIYASQGIAVASICGRRFYLRPALNNYGVTHW